MREPIRDKDRLEHILKSMRYVEEFVDGLDFDAFRTNKLHYFAIVKNIEIIGEAAYMLSNEFKEQHTQTPWKMISGMRHYIVHGYYQVDDKVVWNVINEDLPQLKSQIEKYIQEFGK